VTNSDRRFVHVIAWTLENGPVREIKTELAIGTRNAVLARQYHVSTSAICDIKKGRKWSEVAI